MRSVTEQGALDEFLSTAELAGTDFTADKIDSMKIIHPSQKNPYLLSAAEERSAIRKQMSRRNRLTVPRRPPWSDNTTPRELDEKEKASFLEWRRDLADVQENDDLLMTPFERNLEVWRQLWRVTERSDLIVQIVDARNPLMFRSEDLERYVKEVDRKKSNLLLVNKADMMTLRQRTAWAEYFERNNINYRFFSASLARESLDSVEEDAARIPEDQSIDKPEPDSLGDPNDTLTEVAKDLDLEDQEKEHAQWTDEETFDGDSDPRTSILTVDELEELFLQNVPSPKENSHDETPKTVVGLVGYPNVGKSSTINALVGAKKVSVSATPGKTKHFQTIHLSPQVVLCDCPGLVFPNFATTKAELVCNGILPIDQLREFTGPSSLVAQRIPQSFLESIYGIKVHIRPLEEGGTGVPTAEEVLRAFAKARGFATTGQGQPDQSRAARHILKDYVSGKLLFCHPPPIDPPIDSQDFNEELYDLAHLPTKRRALRAAQQVESENGLETTSLTKEAPTARAPMQGPKSKSLDKKFFRENQGNIGHLSTPFAFQADSQDRRQLTGRKLQAIQALEKGLDPAEARLVVGSKKHFKGNKRKKATVRDEE